MILVSVEGDDAERLQRLSDRRGKTSADVVTDLLRDADRSVACHSASGDVGDGVDGRDCAALAFVGDSNAVVPQTASSRVCAGLQPQPEPAGGVAQRA
jgi:hypothetical protein